MHEYHSCIARCEYSFFVAQNKFQQFCSTYFLHGHISWALRPRAFRGVTLNINKQQTKTKQNEIKIEQTMGRKKYIHKIHTTCKPNATQNAFAFIYFRFAYFVETWKFFFVFYLFDLEFICSATCVNLFNCLQSSSILEWNVWLRTNAARVS